MKTGSQRCQRVARELQRRIGLWFAQGGGDERFRAVTLTRVELSPDLRFARFLFALEPGASETPESVELALARAQARIRREIGRGWTLRHVPEIRFAYDRELESVRRVDDLLQTIKPPQT
ncbi:ribosome-binding factor A [mine drainage metagenome]|uniref:Ribosome-binding factor A n=1 Tax=mine drainage metagenome TaxID=410659 RepID=T1BEA4_9ZZZZ